MGVAQPVLEAALKGEKELERYMLQMERDLKIALFCSGCKDIEQLQQVRPVEWIQK